MSDSLLGKMTLYDLLAMVVPGGLILYAVLCLFANPPLPLCADNGWCRLALFVISSYALGLTYHKLIVEGILFKTLYNNVEEHIREEEAKVWSHFEHPCESIKITRHNYYEASYALEKKGLGSIPILEAQVAFLKNILFPLPLALLCPLFPNEMDRSMYGCLCVGLVLSVGLVYWYKQREAVKEDRGFVCYIQLCLLGLVLAGCLCRYEHLDPRIVLLLVGTLIYAYGVLHAIDQIQRKVYSMVWERYYHLLSGKRIDPRS